MTAITEEAAGWMRQLIDAFHDQEGAYAVLARYRDDVLEEAARAAEEHTEHMDFGAQPQDHHEAPYRCNVAEAIRALKATS
jgi:hypothetical protein